VHVFCAVLAWSRFRFVRFAADEKAETNSCAPGVTYSIQPRLRCRAIPVRVGWRGCAATRWRSSPGSAVTTTPDLNKVGTGIHPTRC